MGQGELRMAIREILAEELEKIRRDPSPAEGSSAAEETVSLTNDRELAAFVRRILDLGGDPKATEEIKKGRRTFRLDSSPPASAESGVIRIGAGLVGESRIAAIPEGSTIEIDEGARLTPLAQDEIRRRKLREVRRGK